MRANAGERGEIIDTHEGFWVDATVGQTGVLRVQEYDLNGEITGWEVYADGKWESFRLIEPPTADAVRTRALAEQSVPGGFPNGGSAYGVR